MRKQRPRGTITREAVLDAALAIVDRVGVSGLTIRGVAKEVGAPPMSLYSHFTKKDELLDLMYGELTRRLYPDQGHPTWQLELFALCQHIRAELGRHSLWTPLLARPVTPLAVPVRERILGMMVADGMTPQSAFSVLSSAVLGSIGFALGELSLRHPDGGSSVERRYERMREWSAGAKDSPVTQAAIANRPTFDRDAIFTFMVQNLIRGFEGERQPSSAGS